MIWNPRQVQELMQNVCTVLVQVKAANKVHSELTKKVKKSEGDCCMHLEEILQDLHIQRQQYHGRSFVGNHIHKMLQLFKKCIVVAINVQ